MTKRIKYLGINLPKETKYLYTENFKTLMKEIKDDANREKYTMFIDWKNQYSKVVGYKTNTQKSLAFLYSNNEKIEREIKETIPFTIAMKRIKYLGIYLPKETKEIYIKL